MMVRVLGRTFRRAQEIVLPTVRLCRDRGWRHLCAAWLALLALLALLGTGWRGAGRLARAKVGPALLQRGRSWHLLAAPGARLAVSRLQPWFRPRLSLKLTIPYLVLALSIGLGGVYLVARLEATLLNNSFSRQLSDAGLRVADSVVLQERAQLEDVRAIAYMEGVSEALLAHDPAALDRLVLGYALNRGLGRVVLLNAEGRQFWSLTADDQRPADYRTRYARWPFVDAVLQGKLDAGGDKFIGLAQEPELGWVLYTAGPILQGPRLVGVVLVGTPLHELVRQWRTSTLADVTIYDQRGCLLASSLGGAAAGRAASLVSAQQPAHAGCGANDSRGAELPPPLPPELHAAARTRAASDPQRRIDLGSRSYAEIVGAFSVRGDQVLGAVGAALPLTGAEEVSVRMAASLLLLFTLGSITIVLVGLWLARRIVAPVSDLVEASEAVANGDLTQQLPLRSRDELGELTKAFNMMVAGLRERERIREHFGRFVSPTVVELVLQRSVELKDELRLLTIFFTDIRNFTIMAEQQEPAQVVRTLNDYFSIVVAAAERYGGLVNKFGGDSTLVIFGLTSSDPQGTASAQAAIKTALDIRHQLSTLNQGRLARGLEPIEAGIGINTGHVIAGLVGPAQRVEYTVIGDAVNLSARIQGLSRELGHDILISGATYAALGAPRGLHLSDLGSHEVKGKQQAVQIYSVLDWEGRDVPA